MNLKKLRVLKQGSLCDDNILKLIAPNFNKQTEIKIKSGKVADEGLKEIFIKNEDLVKLDISGCPKINGHCFEELISFKLQEVRISFDDYRLKCLKKLLNDKGIKGCNIINIV